MTILERSQTFSVVISIDLLAWVLIQEWLNTETVVVGTKCNKLLCLNTSSNQVPTLHSPLNLCATLCCRAHHNQHEESNYWIVPEVFQSIVSARAGQPGITGSISLCTVKSSSP